MCVAKQWILLVKSRVSGAVVGDQKKGSRRFNCITELSGNQDCLV